MTNNNYLNDDQHRTLAEAADILGEFGYESEADIIGGIMEQEMTISYRPELGQAGRDSPGYVRFDVLVSEARKLATRTDCGKTIAKLVANVKPETADDATQFITGENPNG